MDDILIRAQAVRARYGGISDMTISRWLRTPHIRFPAPQYIGPVRYWRVSDLDAFDARRAREAEAKKSPPAHGAQAA